MSRPPKRPAQTRVGLWSGVAIEVLSGEEQDRYHAMSSSLRRPLAI
jgi:hypothetical protein